MATLNTTNIKHGSSGSNNIVLASNGSVTIPTLTATSLTTNSSFGKILQVVTVSDSVRDTTGTVSLSSANTYYDTPFAVTITPSATSSKILLMGHVMGEASTDDYTMMWRVKRAISGGSTTNIQASSAGSRPQGISMFPSGFYSGNNESTTTVANFAGLVDTPSTTSAITYTFQVNATQTNSATFYYNRTMGTSDGIDYERGLSWITAQEVAA
tara:strand:+ start:1158 stop:1796 length:639 start_codon:yes stop_codon:yes gene_type:complete